MSLGHASLRLPSGAYASFYPARDIRALEEGGFVEKIRGARESRWIETYEHDVRILGREADETIEVPGLSEEQMLKTWEQLYEESYSAARNNCCRVATRLLHAGVVEPEGMWEFVRHELRMVWHVTSDLRLAKAYTAQVFRDVGLGFLTGDDPMAIDSQTPAMVAAEARSLAAWSRRHQLEEAT